MDKLNIKKIIAREGLIAIGVIMIICFIVLISFFYPPHFKIENKYPRKEPFTDEQFTVLKGKGLTLDEIVGLHKGKYVDMTQWKELTDEEIKKIHELHAITKELEQRVNIKRQKMRYYSTGTIFILYLLYLLPIRFILWATKILRKK